MTFSLVARDPQTGAFGMVISSSSPAVASRCLHMRSGVGAVASQNVTNPALGPTILDALEYGLGSHSALTRGLKQEEHPDHRQVLVIDNQGTIGHHSGAHSLGVNHSAWSGQAVAAGNLLKSPSTVDSLLHAYQSSTASAFEARLLAGLTQAMEAGGEAGPVRSAGLKIVEHVSWATTDLRVDDADNPVAELNRLWQLWEPEKQKYLTRALNPNAAPSYGVPGET